MGPAVMASGSGEWTGSHEDTWGAALACPVLGKGPKLGREVHVTPGLGALSV